jgi:hypothetical protein
MGRIGADFRRIHRCTFRCVGLRRSIRFSRPGNVHGAIDYAESYVNDQIHTNGIENFWSLLKRGLHGSYVSVELFHLFRQIDEQAFRDNTRKGMNDLTRFKLAVSQIVDKRLTYKALIGQDDSTTPL